MRDFFLCVVHEEQCSVFAQDWKEELRRVLARREFAPGYVMNAQQCKEIYDEQGKSTECLCEEVE